ncbi:MAG: response regulator [Polyangiaceae bacterium]|nr:response regulator [Polyangiaceae bacterium]
MSSRTTPVVLVADDEPSMLTLVARHVRTLGYAVLEASDGEAAWQQAAKTLPDLVVLDVMMPGMSGWEVCRRIRESVGLAHTGVIMLTGIGQSLNELTSPLYGADAYVDKPFEFKDLDRKIRQVLSARGHEPLISEPSLSHDAFALEEEQATARELRDAAAAPDVQAAHALEGVARANASTQDQRGFGENPAELAPTEELAHFHSADANAAAEDDEFSMAVTLRPPRSSSRAATSVAVPMARAKALAAAASHADIDDDALETRRPAPLKPLHKAAGTKAGKEPAKKAAEKPAKKAAAKPANKAAKSANKAAKPANKAAKPAKKAAKRANKPMREDKHPAREASAKRR